MELIEHLEYLGFKFQIDYWLFKYDDCLVNVMINPNRLLVGKHPGEGYTEDSFRTTREFDKLLKLRGVTDGRSKNTQTCRVS